jgi:hypothetical protein
MTAFPRDFHRSKRAAPKPIPIHAPTAGEHGEDGERGLALRPPSTRANLRSPNGSTPHL